MGSDGTGAGNAGASGRVAVVGPAEVVIPFRASGLEVFPVEASTDPLALVEKLLREGYQLIFFTDDIAERLQPVLERHRFSALPCLVALPLTGSTAGEDKLRAAVRRACGVDVLSTKPGGQ